MREILSIENLWHGKKRFEHAQNLNSGFVDGSCAVVTTTTPRHHKVSYDVLYELLRESLVTICFYALLYDVL